MSEQKYEMAQEIQSLRRQVKRLEQDLALESSRYQAAIVESARRQAAIDAAEDRDVGIGRYELIRQRNKAEAQRDELQRQLEDARKGKLALADRVLKAETQRDELLAAVNTAEAVRLQETRLKLKAEAQCDELLAALKDARPTLSNAVQDSVTMGQKAYKERCS